MSCLFYLGHLVFPLQILVQKLWQDWLSLRLQHSSVFIAATKAVALPKSCLPRNPIHLTRIWQTGFNRKHSAQRLSDIQNTSARRKWKPSMAPYAELYKECCQKSFQVLIWTNEHFQTVTTWNTLLRFVVWCRTAFPCPLFHVMQRLHFQSCPINVSGGYCTKQMTLIVTMMHLFMIQMLPGLTTLQKTSWRYIQYGYLVMFLLPVNRSFTCTVADWFLWFRSLWLCKSC